jgi:gliding motility-associated-like protein
MKIISFTIFILLIGSTNIDAQNNCPSIQSVSPSISICNGTNTTFSVVATSPDYSPLTYAWYKNGVLIQNAISSSFTITNAQLSDATDYYVAVSNACGTPTNSSIISLSVGTIPSISNIDNSAVTLCAGSNFSTSVIANSNSIPFTYQWYFSGIPMIGQTASSLNITNVQSSNAGLYSVNLSNVCGIASFSGQQLSIDAAPIISTQPIGGLVCTGNSFSMTPIVNNATNYQWTKNNTNYSTGSSLTITSVQSSDAGTYSLTASNGCGTVTSNSATLITKSIPTIISIGASNSVCSGTNTSLTALANGNGDNSLLYTWSLSGVGIGSSASNVLSISNFQQANVGTYSLSVSNSCGSVSTSNQQSVALQLSSLPTIPEISTPSAVCSSGALTVPSNVTTNNGGTLSYQWYNTNQAISNQTSAQLLINNIQPSAAGSYYLMATNNCGSTISNAFSVLVNTAPVITQQPLSQTICTGTTLSLSVVATAGSSYQWNYNGQAIPNATSASYSKNNIQSSDAGNYTVSVINSCGNTTSASAIVVVNTPPIINVQPQAQNVCVGSPVTFQVSTSNNPIATLSYQWFESGTTIAGATNSSYTIQSANANNAAYTYSVEISNSCGTINSNSASLVVNQLPTVSISSDKTTECINTGTISFTSNVTGNNLSYAWYQGQALVGTSSSLTLSNFNASAAGSYSLVVSNSCASIISNSINIATMAPPTITSDIISSSINACVGSNISLSLIANTNNGGTLSYNWIGGTNNLNTTTINNSYTINNFTAQNEGTYHVLVSNSCGIVSSGYVNIALNSLTNAITTQPISSNVCNGNSYTLSVGLSGNYNNLTYSWLHNNIPISNSNSATYTISNVNSNSAGNYSVVISSACDQVTSSIATVSLYSTPNFSVNPESLNACIGSNTSFNTSINASNGNGVVKTPMSFNWYQNGNLLSQNITSTNTQTSLSLNNINSNNQGNYQIIATDGCNNIITTNIFTLTVNSTPTFTIQPQNVTFCSASTNGSPNSATLTASAKNADQTTTNLVYQWYINGAPISGANESSFIATLAGTYYVTATNSSNNCGFTQSASATVTAYSLPKATSVTSNFALCNTTNQTKAITLVPSSNDGTTPLVTWSTTNGNIITTNWNGITVGPTSANPTVIYNYSITNTCGYTNGSVSVETEMNLLSVVSYAPSSPSNQFCAGNNVSLNIKTNSTASDYVNYIWSLNGNIVQSTDFNNINSNSYTSLIPVGTTQGSETFLVTVSNVCGALANPVSIPISINPTLSAKFSIANLNTQCLEGNSFAFTNSTTNYDNVQNDLISYIWNFGDGQTQVTSGLTSPNNHTYTTSGTKNVSLIGTNMYGCSDSASSSLTVQSAPIFTLQPTVDTTICSGSSYQLTTAINNGGNNSLSYQWYFNDVSHPITGANQANYIITSMNASSAGNYILQVINSGCGYSTLSTTAKVNYQQLPVAAFTFSNNAANFANGATAIACASNSSFNFTATTPAIAGITYLWNFGDGTTANSQSVSHLYSIGAYTLNLTTSANGCSSSTNITPTYIQINGAPSISQDLPSSLTIKNGNAINLSVSALSNNITNNSQFSTLNYQWYFNNNIIPSSNLSTYTINSASNSNAGQYYLNIKNACGSVNSNIINVSIIDAPVITTQPINQSICIGSNTSLSVSATVNDGTIPTYQWYFQQNLSIGGPLPIAQAVTNVLSLSSFSQSNVGYYYVTVTNTVGTTNSNVVYIGDESAPTLSSIVTTPSNLGNICINTNVQFSATYQSKRNTSPNIAWLHNGQVLNNQNSLQLNLNNINIADSGMYILKVSNSCGQINDTTNLSIQNIPQFTQAPSKTIACLGSNTVISAIVENPTANDSYQWIKDGVAYTGSELINNNSIAFNNIQLQDSGKYALSVTNGCGINTTSNASLSVVGNPTIVQQPVNITTCVNTQVIDPVIANSADNVLNYAWYKNGVLQPALLSPQLNFTSITSNDAGNYKTIITNGCNNSVTSNAFQITVEDLVSLNSTISNKTLCVGNSLNVDLTGLLKNVDNNTSYQWELNNINLNYNSAQTIDLQNQNIQRSDAGTYSISVKNSCGINQIQLFNLNVNGIPSIIGEPVSASICEGSSFNNNITISNPDQLFCSYQWIKNGIQIPGANSNIYSINNASYSDQAQYQVTITNQCGIIQSNITSLQVNAKPTLQIQVTSPTSQCIGGNSFNFNGIIQMSDNTMPSINWNLGDGASSSTTIVQHSYNSPNAFNVILTAISSKGCTDTTSQLIYVNSSPFILQQPQNLVICKGGEADLQVQVKHNPNQLFGYQWYLGDQIISNGTDSTYKIANLQNDQTGFYKVLIQNQCGNIMSNPMQLQMAQPPLETNLFPDSTKICDSSSFILNPTIYSLLPNTFQWYKNGMPLIGQTNDSLLFVNYNVNNNGKYYVTVQNNCGIITTSTTKLIDRVAPSSTQLSIEDTICHGSIIALTYKRDNLFNNDDSINFSWYKNNQILNIYNDTLNIHSFNNNDIGFYNLRIGNSCGYYNVPIANLVMNYPKVGFVSDNTNACSGNLTLHLTDTSKGLFNVANNYWYSTPNNILLKDSSVINYTYSQPGKYKIQHAITDASGCSSDTVYQYVINYGNPNASFIIHDTCLSDLSLPINTSSLGFGSTIFTKFTWNFGDTTIVTNNYVAPNYLYKNPGQKNIQLIVATDSSCVSDTISKSFMVIGKPQAQFKIENSCQFFPVNMFSTSYSAYLPDSIGQLIWNFGDSSSLSSLKNPVHIYSQYGAYVINLRAMSATCPFLYSDTSINYYIKHPRENFTYPIIHAVKFEPYQLNAENGGVSYNWYPFTGLSNTQIQDPMISIDSGKIIYTVSITDSSGCVLKDTQEVWSFPKTDIYLATAFSPNGDGINDYYQPVYVGIKYLEYFRIADKNNRQVFITNNLSDKWDGTSNGTPLVADAYIVDVSGIDILGNRIKKQGIIILVK